MSFEVIQILYDRERERAGGRERERERERERGGRQGVKGELRAQKSCLFYCFD